MVHASRRRPYRNPHPAVALVQGFAEMKPRDQVKSALQLASRQLLDDGVSKLELARAFLGMALNILTRAEVPLEIYIGAVGSQVERPPDAVQISD